MPFPVRNISQNGGEGLCLVSMIQVLQEVSFNLKIMTAVHLGWPIYRTFLKSENSLHSLPSQFCWKRGDDNLFDYDICDPEWVSTIPHNIGHLQGSLHSNFCIAWKILIEVTSLHIATFLGLSWSFFFFNWCWKCHTNLFSCSLTIYKLSTRNISLSKHPTRPTYFLGWFRLPSLKFGQAL